MRAHGSSTARHRPARSAGAARAEPRAARRSAAYRADRARRRPHGRPRARDLATSSRSARASTHADTTRSRSRSSRRGSSTTATADLAIAPGERARPTRSVAAASSCCGPCSARRRRVALGMLVDHVGADRLRHLAASARRPDRARRVARPAAVALVGTRLGTFDAIVLATLFRAPIEVYVLLRTLFAQRVSHADAMRARRRSTTSCSPAIARVLRAAPRHVPAVRLDASSQCT